MKETLGTVV